MDFQEWKNFKGGKAVLKTVSIKTPVYNIHSKKDICKDVKYEDFKYLR